MWKGLWKCSVCGYEYSEAVETTPFEELFEEWGCPVCNAPKEAFEKLR